MNYDQIRSLVYLKTKTNITSLPNASLNLYTQPAEDHVVALINRFDSRWQFDDGNYIDFPIATTQINSGQQDYSLATSHLSIDRAEIKDSSGAWHLLKPIDQQDDRLNALDVVATGLPKEYDKTSNSAFLYPIPDYTSTAALKLYFTRGPLKYDYTANTNAGQFTDGTGSGASSDIPGFNSLFHDLIPTWASYNFAINNGQRSAAGFLGEIQLKEQSLEEFFGNRNRDYTPRLRPSTDSNK